MVGRSGCFETCRWDFGSGLCDGRCERPGVRVIDVSESHVFHKDVSRLYPRSYLTDRRAVAQDRTMVIVGNQRRSIDEVKRNQETMSLLPEIYVCCIMNYCGTQQCEICYGCSGVRENRGGSTKYIILRETLGKQSLG